MIKPVTFFDIVSAMRDRRVMRFTTPTITFDSPINGVLVYDRGYPTVWRLQVNAGEVLQWNENNLVVVITEIV